ncbi:MAG TPA: HXXEE domain-containing protein [Candidatus Aminicenantes bacterium]|nr:HXXEE domain-containing protein [Candidatus Aminicenantes bacterium]
MKIETLCWLLPVVFMLHDFEEIIMLRPWFAQNEVLLRLRFPRVAARLLPHFKRLSTSSFALAVAEEFLVMSVITVLVVELELYALWSAVVLAFLIHLLFHMSQYLMYRRYVPVISLSVPAALFCVWAVFRLNQVHPLVWSDVLLLTPLMLIVLAGNLFVAHHLALRFERFLRENYNSR